MATSTRLTSNGTFYTTGQIDEATFNPNSGYIKNLLITTETFNGLGWTLNSGLLTQNATLAPDGVSLAPKLNEGPASAGSGAQRIYYKPAVTAGTVYTYSIYLKAAERYILRIYFEDTQTGGGGRIGQFLNIKTGTILSTYSTGTNTLLGSNLQNVGNGWYRYSWTVKALLSSPIYTGTSYIIISQSYDDTAQIFSYVGDGTSGLYIWGAQQEVNNSVSIYQGVNAASTLITTKAKYRKDANGNYYVASSLDETTYNNSALNINTQFNGPTVNLVRSSNNLTLIAASNALVNNTTLPFYQFTPAEPCFCNRTIATQDPFGGYDAFKLGGVANTTSAYIGFTQSTNQYFNSGNGSGASGRYLKAGATYCYSVYAKAAEYGYVRFGMYDALPNGGGGSWELEFNLRTGVVSTPNAYQTAGMINVGNGWYRCWVTRIIQDTTPGGNPGGFDIIANPAGFGNFVPDGTSGAYIYGVQVELGNYPSKYVATNMNGPINNFASRIDANGNSQLTGTYDEFTKGMNIITNGLIYNMDPSKPESWTGSNAIYDSTKKNPQGSIVGSYNYNIDGGGTIALDGLTAYANTGILGNTAPFQTTSEFTMSIWCKFTGPTKTTSGTSTLFGAFNFQGFGICWSPGTNNLPGAIYSVVRPNNGIEYGSYTSNAADFQLNRWYNYVFTYSGSNLANTSFLYVNSSKATSGGVQYGNNLPYSTNMNGIYITIGNILPESGGPSGYFPGRIGQALIYNRALSAAEIAQNFNEMRSQYGV